jgi:hypothetical protein
VPKLRSQRNGHVPWGVHPVQFSFSRQFLLT